nr:Gag-Pol polyprotein [Tanacetum cinerariifolium]
AEAIATACFTQNRSLVVPRHEKTPYHIINEQKPSVKFFHIFGSTDTTSNELDLLFCPMFDELLNGSPKVVSKSSAVSAADESNQRQQPTTPLNNHTTPAPSCQTPTIATTVTSYENINQADPHAKNDERWTKDHPLEQVIGNPSQSVRTRRQLESDAEMCMFALTVSRTEPKNIKEAMEDSAGLNRCRKNSISLID